MEVAEVTSSGKEFQSVMTWLEKKFWIDAKENLNVCPLHAMKSYQSIKFPYQHHL